MTLRASVVIPTFRRHELLLRCVGALLRQDLPANEFEIVIVDDGSPRDAFHAAHEALRPLAQRRGVPAIRHLRLAHNSGPAAARNFGWRAARAPVIAFTDDDTIPLFDWLTQGLRALAYDAAAVSGHVIVPVRSVPTDYERDAAGLHGAWFVTANCFVRRSALERVGGFDERFRAAWREDTDLWFSLRAHRLAIVHAPRACVMHPVRPERWGVSLRQQRKVMFDALLYKKFPRWYREHIRPHPPWHYYAVVSSMLAACVCAWRGAMLAAAIAVAIAMALVLGFALQRLARASKSPLHVVEMVVTSLLIPWLSVYWRARGAWRFRVPFI
jgi:GT2 family glycosyltransferase